MNLLVKLALSVAIIASTTSHAEIKETSQQPADIAVLNDARVFSKFNDKYPAMVNYFTQADFASIKQFYSAEYGAPSSERVQYGRLELQFNHLQTNIRVIVDEQARYHEVAVIVIDKATNE